MKIMANERTGSMGVSQGLNTSYVLSVSYASSVAVYDANNHMHLI